MRLAKAQPAPKLGQQLFLGFQPPTPRHESLDMRDKAHHHESGQSSQDPNKLSVADHHLAVEGVVAVEAAVEAAEVMDTAH